MRIAIADDLADERTSMKERLARQISLRSAEADILEFDSGEVFPAAEKKQCFHFAHMINIHTAVGKTLATRQAFMEYLLQRGRIG